MRELLQTNPILPLLSASSVNEAISIGRSLMEGGISIVEVPLRTDIALRLIEALRQTIPEITVGAGTVKSPMDFHQARNAGAQFIVSPGFTPALLAEIQLWQLPFLPGAVTSSEIMTLADLGFDVIKFFPAAASGGISALAALKGPFPGIRFCPSGGVGQTNYLDYLALDNVLSVSGSWLTATAVVDSTDEATDFGTTDYDAISSRCREALANIGQAALTQAVKKAAP